MTDLNALGTLINEPAKVDQLKMTLGELVYGEPGALCHGFPVSVPVTLSRRDLAFMRKKAHWVAEKTEGERVLLMASAKQTYIINSRLDFYQVDGEKFYLPKRKDTKSRQDKTLLDCMVTWSFAYEKSVLVILDVFVVDGYRVADSFFRTRLETIREGVVGPLRTTFPSDKFAVVDNENIPFVVQGKEYFMAEQVGVILSRIKRDQMHRYVYESNSRHNVTEGLIFVPEELPLRLGICPALKKWKFPELTSVIFEIDIILEPRPDPSFPPKHTFIAYAGGNDGRLNFYREIFFRREDAERLVNGWKEWWTMNGRDLPERSGADRYDEPAPVECVYDARHGEWRFCQLRVGVEASHYANIMRQLEATAEAISPDELKAWFHKSREHSNPETPATPRTPAVVQAPGVGKGAGTNSDTPSPSPPPVQGTKRPLDDTDRDETQPMRDAKRQRVDSDSPNH